MSNWSNQLENKWLQPRKLADYWRGPSSGWEDRSRNSSVQILSGNIVQKPVRALFIEVFGIPPGAGREIPSSCRCPPGTGKAATRCATPPHLYPHPPISTPLTVPWVGIVCSWEQGGADAVGGVAGLTALGSLRLFLGGTQRWLKRELARLQELGSVLREVKKADAQCTLLRRGGGGRCAGFGIASNQLAREVGSLLTTGVGGGEVLRLHPPGPLGSPQ